MPVERRKVRCFSVEKQDGAAFAFIGFVQHLPLIRHWLLPTLCFYLLMMEKLVPVYQILNTCHNQWRAPFVSRHSHSALPPPAVWHRIRWAENWWRLVTVHFLPPFTPFLNQFISYIDAFTDKGRVVCRNLIYTVKYCNFFWSRDGICIGEVWAL